MNDRTDIPLSAMLEEVEREIVARKRSYGARAEEIDTTAWKMVETMKALASYLRRTIEEQKTGARSAIEWHQHDPGRAMPASLEGPLLLSVLSPIPSGGYRREVRVMDRKEDPRLVAENVYAWADWPRPAPVEDGACVAEPIPEA